MTRVSGSHPVLAKVGDVLLADRQWERAAFGYESDGCIRLMMPEILAADEATPPTSGIRVDPSRINAKYVVIRAELEGGGTGHGPHDVYPDGWHVTARRLRPDGTYDPDGETVEFYQTGCFHHMLRHPKIVGQMRMIFVG